jgi:hypothetical protein
MLDELTLTTEPKCPGAAGPSVHGFTTHNRFIRGKSQAYVGPNGCENIRYHGLDYMLLHNLYAIATPYTWNGSPDADPCQPLAPDGAPVTGDDAGVGPDDPDDDPDDDAMTGCGCESSRPGASWLLIVIVGVALSARSRRGRAWRLQRRAS